MPTFLFILYNLFTIKYSGQKGRVVITITLPLNYNYHCPTEGYASLRNIPSVSKMPHCPLTVVIMQHFACFVKSFGQRTIDIKE